MQAVRLHSFAVPHNGTEAVARHVAVNAGAARDFQVVFVGSSGAHRALLANGFREAQVDAAQTALQNQLFAGMDSDDESECD